MEKREIHCHANIFSSNQFTASSLAYLLSKEVDFTKFLQQNGGTHSHSVEITVYSHSFMAKIS